MLLRTFKKIFFFGKKRENNVCFFMLDETDTSIYFLIVEKVAVSLPIKCTSNPTSGSGLIGDNWLGHAHNPGFVYTNRFLFLQNAGKHKLIPESGRGLTCNRQSILHH